MPYSPVHESWGIPKKIEKLGKASGVKVRFEPKRGKGSHGTLFYGGKFTTLKDRKREVSRALLNEMCKQLGIRSKDIYPWRALIMTDRFTYPVDLTDNGIGGLIARCRICQVR